MSAQADPSEQVLPGQLDPFVGDQGDPVAIADLEGETEYMQEVDDELERTGPQRVPLASEVIGPNADPAIAASIVDAGA